MNTEYRKAMYRNGEYTSVGNAEEEAEKRAEGWTDWYTDQDRMNGKASANPGDDHIRNIKLMTALLHGDMPLQTPLPTDPPKRKPGRPPKAK